MREKALSLALGAIFGSVVLTSQAAVLNVTNLTVTGGSFYLTGSPTVNPAITAGPGEPIVTGGYQGGTANASAEPNPAQTLTNFKYFGTPVYTFTAQSAENLVSAPTGTIAGGKAPSGTIDTGAGTLSMDMSGWFASWNGTNFNQGGAATGTISSCTVSNGATTCAYTMAWRSTVVGGPFNGQTGVWSLNGTVSTAAATTTAKATVTPGDGSTVSYNNPSISVTFSEKVTSAAGFVSIATTGTGSPSVGAPTSADGLTYTFPLSGLQPGQSYTLSFNAAQATTASGDSVVAPPTETVTAALVPAMTATTPQANTSISPSTSTITVNFNEPMNPSTVASFPSVSGGVTVGTPTTTDDMAFVYPVSGLNKSTTYTVTFNAGATDAEGDPLTAPPAINFSTTGGINPVLSAATGDNLTICPGSKFAMEVSPGKQLFTTISQSHPIEIGVTQGYAGLPGVSNTPIDNTWSFFSAPGYEYTVKPVTDYGNGHLDLSGWTVAWNTTPAIPMGSGAPATFQWDGVYGHPYTLVYSAIVPSGPFINIPYTLYLTGNVNGGPSGVDVPCSGAVVTPHGAVTVAVDGSGTTPPVTLNSQLSPSDTDLRAAGYSPAARPAGFDFYRYGVITYTVGSPTQPVTGTVGVTLTFPTALPAGTRIYKVTKSGWTDITNQVTISSDGMTLTMNVAVNGPLNEDPGSGMIVDPLAVGIPLNTTTSGGAGGGVGGSGGCTLDPNGGFDPVLVGMVLASVGYLTRRRRRKS